MKKKSVCSLTPEAKKARLNIPRKNLLIMFLEFNDIDAGDIATHRTDVTILWLEDDAHAWKENDP